MQEQGLSLREIQLLELEILKEFAALCERHGLRYYLIGGTLLGAVRHQGFIPWDDDVDVGMPRPDYEKFLALDLSGELPRHISRLDRSDPQSAYSFAKLIDLRTQVKTVFTDESADRHLWIDIFPIDGVPDSLQKCKLLFKRVMFWQRVQGLCHAKPDAGSTSLRRAFKRYLKPLAQAIGNMTCTERVEKLAQGYSFDKAKKIAVVNGGLKGIREVMDKAAWLQEAQETFEGAPFPVPGRARTYLKNLYGNYMQPPNEAGRKQHILSVYMRAF